jgi:hypothetical protein
MADEAASGLKSTGGSDGSLSDRDAPQGLPGSAAASSGGTGEAGMGGNGGASNMPDRY